MTPFLCMTLFFLAHANILYAQDNQTREVTHPELRMVLRSMADIDQAVREELIQKGLGNLDSVDVVRQEAIDEANVRLLSKMVDEYGWPSSTMVGKEGVEAALLIVQHADLDFQKEMLPYIRRSYERGDAPAGDYALLIDRVLVDSGKLQRYGTQAEIQNGRLVVLPMEDKARVDERRESLGLEPLADYIKRLEEFYGVRYEGVDY